MTFEQFNTHIDDSSLVPELVENNAYLPVLRISFASLHFSANDMEFETIFIHEAVNEHNSEGGHI